MIVAFTPEQAEKEIGQLEAEIASLLESDDDWRAKIELLSTAPGVAKVTSAGNPPVYQRTSRQIQLALKLYF